MACFAVRREGYGSAVSEAAVPWCGGLGEVHLARDEELDREVVLKEIRSEYADHDDSRERFVREAEITGKLEHPGIVPVYGLGSYVDGRPFYAMRFIRGESMLDAIDRLHGASCLRSSERVSCATCSGALSQCATRWPMPTRAGSFIAT